MMRVQENTSRICTFRMAAALGLLFFPSAILAQLQAPNVQPLDHVDAVAITVTPFGPYPAKITHGPGPFVLVVINHSGVPVGTFSLVRKAPHAASSASPVSQGTAHAAQQSLLDLHSTRSRHRDHKLIRALPGSYQLRFLSRPNWVVNITITGN